MSDLTSHTRDDLVELPSDCEPPANIAVFDPHLAEPCPECGHGAKCSPALCSRRRMMHLKQRLDASLRLISRPEPHTSGVLVELAEERAKRRRK
jgi:hypothetical protein